MQFPGMMPLQYAQSSPLTDSLKKLNTTLGQPTAAPATTPAPAPGPAPMDISPAATNSGTNMPQPGIMAALKGLSPQQILDQLRSMSANGQSVAPQGMPGSAALDSAGMLSPDVPMSASGMPLSLIAGG